MHDKLEDDGEDVDEPIEANTGRKSDRMSARAYHAFRIFTRPDDFNTLQRGCRLWQQYLVDAWATIEQSRLQWVTDHQDELRADLYKGLADAIAAADIDFQIAESCGRKIVLPSGHVGSARYMQSLFHDAMAIVQYKGPPTLFITFTANPNWDEITRELFPGQTVQDRPDLVARVFELKKKELLHELKQKAIFGKASARFWTIEYQKRGLPHCHLLLFLDDHDQFLQPDNIDQVVCAELPDPGLDPELCKIVRECMIHTPCGAEYDATASCCEFVPKLGQHVCSKRFPKAFSDYIVLSESGYP